MPEVPSSQPQSQPQPAPQNQPSPFQGEGGSKMGLIIGLIVIVVLGGGIFFYMQQQKGSETELTEVSSTTTAPITTTTPTTTPTTPTPTTPTTPVTPTQPSTSAGYMTYSDSLYGFQIDYPRDWEMDDSSGLVAVMFFSPFEDDFDAFSENVNITTEDVSFYAPITLEEYGDAAYEQLLIALPEYGLVERDSRNLGSLEAEFLLGSYTLEGIELEVLSLFAMQDDIVYVLTFTYEVGEEIQIEDQVEQMIDSFKLI